MYQLVNVPGQKAIGCRVLVSVDVGLIAAMYNPVK